MVVSAFIGPDAPKPYFNRPFLPLKLGSDSWEPCPFKEIPDSFQHQISNTTGVKKRGVGWGRNPVRYSVARASHVHKT